MKALSLSLFPPFLSSSPPLSSSSSSPRAGDSVAHCCLLLAAAVSCICSSLLSSLCRGGPGGIVVLVCVPRPVLSTWQFSASRQGGKSILSDLWRCPLCNNNTAQRRAGSGTWHIPSHPPGPRQGAPFALILTPSYFQQGPLFHFNTPFSSTSLCFFSLQGLQPAVYQIACFFFILWNVCFYYTTGWRVHLVYVAAVHVSQRGDECVESVIYAEIS